MMRARTSDSRVRCGRPRCRGVLGMVALITYVFPDGHEGPPSPLLQIPSIFVQHEDADGEIWEEPEQRRSAACAGSGPNTTSDASAGRRMGRSKPCRVNPSRLPSYRSASAAPAAAGSRSSTGITCRMTSAAPRSKLHRGIKYRLSA